MQTGSRLIARAVVIKEGKILVVRYEGGTANNFLPGGEVGENESIPEALEREIIKKTGEKPLIKKHLGAIENYNLENGAQSGEITHIFEAEIPNPNNKELSPQEDCVEFLWLNPEDLEKINLNLPGVQELIVRWMSEGANEDRQNQ
jgi:ADP-ribose pyrophosphatase YjhB (NUDIX family)